MTAQTLQTRIATAADEAEVLAMMRAFYAEDRIDFVEDRARRAFRLIVADDACGAILLFVDPAAQAPAPGGASGTTAGYAVVTLGFSLEFGGPFALLDELYLCDAARGRGWGRCALDLTKTWARQRGVLALRLEVHHHNPRAKSIYTKAGFRDDHRDMLTVWLE
ncbi:acetyltransferase [Opitutaceae bacterium TAV1]|nr:acetyltransferase [Opitutaceae bacterium TAV1]